MSDDRAAREGLPGDPLHVDANDGRCRKCGSGTLRIIEADDATMTVECEDCGDCYLVEPDAFGDGAMTYWPEVMAKKLADGEDDAAGVRADLLLCARLRMGTFGHDNAPFGNGVENELGKGPGPSVGQGRGGGQMSPNERRWTTEMNWRTLPVMTMSGQRRKRYWLWGGLIAAVAHIAIVQAGWILWWCFENRSLLGPCGQFRGEPNTLFKVLFWWPVYSGGLMFVGDFIAGAAIGAWYGHLVQRRRVRALAHEPEQEV